MASKWNPGLQTHLQDPQLRSLVVPSSSLLPALPQQKKFHPSLGHFQRQVIHIAARSFKGRVRSLLWLAPPHSWKDRGLGQPCPAVPAPAHSDPLVDPSSPVLCTAWCSVTPSSAVSLSQGLWLSC